MPPRQPPGPSEQDGHKQSGHEPPAFETDLERHRGGDDEVYGSHGVQPEMPPVIRRDRSRRKT